jgi:uncharacterized protein (TIGR03086 family)
VAEDPQGAWRQAVARSMMAFGSADPDGTVHTTMGEIPTGLYATQMLTDLTVHGWDVSQGARTAYEPVPDAIEAVWAYSRPRRESNGESAIFDRPVPTDSPDRLDQLVALLGRDPRWGVAHPV